MLAARLIRMQLPHSHLGNRIIPHFVRPPPHPAVFHQVFILKVVKVLCFDTLLQVLILKGLTLH